MDPRSSYPPHHHSSRYITHHHQLSFPINPNNNNNNLYGPHHHHSTLLPAPPLQPPSIRPRPPQQQPSPSYHTPLFNSQVTYNPNQPDLPNFLQSQSPRLLHRSRFDDDLPLPLHRLPDYTRDSRDPHHRVLPPDSYHRQLDNHNPSVQFMHELDGGSCRFVQEHNHQRQDLYVLGRAADEINHHRRDAQFGSATSSNRSSRDFRVVSNQNNRNSSTYERGFVYDDRVSGDDNDFFVNGIVDPGNNGIVNPDGVRLVSGKREHYRCIDGNMEFERHSSKGSREGSYEFNRTPRKLPQKKSVLHRIQKPNRYREDERGHYSGYCGDTKSSSFRSKEHSYLYLDRHVGEQVREGSPVELDVSFKSNSLVAKAIVTPSSCSAGVSDSNLKPRNDKVRKVLVLNKDSSSLPLIKPNEDTVKLDGAISVANTTSSCDKGPKQSKEEVTASGVDNVYDISSLPGSSEAKVSLEKGGVESSTKVNASDKEGTDVVSGKTSLLKVAKKKKIVRVVKKAINPTLSSSRSLPTEKSEEHVIPDSFAHGAPATSEPEKDAATASVDNVDSQPCSIETTLMPENNRVGEFDETIASENGAAADSGRLCASIIKRKRKLSASPPVSSRNEQPKNTETMVNGTSANYLPATSDTVKVITKMLNETACSDIDSVEHASKQLHQNTNSFLFENNAPSGSPKVLLSVERNGNFGLLSPERNNEDPASSCNETLGYESDNGLVNSPEGNTICDIQTTDVGCKQPCTGQGSASVLTGIVDQFLNASFSGGSSKFLWQSNSGETANQNVATCASCSNDGMGTLFNSDNGHTVSGETNFFCHETRDEIRRQPSPDRDSISLESDSVGGSLGCMITRVDCKEDTSDIKKCKKNIEMLQLDLSKSEANDLYLEPVNIVNSACWVDTTLRLSFKDLAQTEFTVPDKGHGDVGSQPCTDGVIVFPQRIADVAEVNVSVNNITTDGSSGTSPQNKRKRKLYGAEMELTCPIASDVNEGPITAAFSASGVEAPSNSHNGLMQPEVEATVSAINPLSPSDFPPFQREITASLDNCSGRVYCSTTVSLGDALEDHGLKGAESHSAAEELAVPEVQFLCPSGSEGEHIANAIPVISGSSNQNTSIVDSGTPWCQFPADLMSPDSDERFPSVDVENDCCRHVKKDLPSISNYLSSEDGNGVSATKLNMDHLETLPDVPSTSYCQLSVEKVGGDNEILDGKPTIQSGYDISAVTSGSSNAEISLSSGDGVEIDHSISERTLFLPLQGSRNSTQTPNAMSREIYGRKIHSNHVISRIYPGRSSFIFTPKSTGTSTHISKPRTWRRADNSSASAPPGNKVFSGSVPTRSQLPRKITRFHNSSYIRKGNSLVRKPSPVAGQSQGSHGLTSSLYQLNSSGTDEVKKIAEPDTRTFVVDPPNSVRTGLNASFERPRTLPLLTATKMPNHATDSLGDDVSSLVEPVHNSGAETASDPMTSAESPDLLKCSEDVVKIAENAIIQTGNANNFDFHNETNDGNMVSSNANGITYIKRKSNQLVATSNPCSSAVNNVNTLSIPSDGYYKRRKNQLIRTSVESHVKQPAASMPDESTNSEGQALHSISSSRSLIKRRLRKGATKTCKPSKFSLVWTLQSSQLSNDDGDSLQCQKVLPHLFPWKRATYWRSFIPISAANTSNGSSSTISRKLLLLRRRDTVYRRSKHGFSLRKSKVLSVGGSSLKWSKSIERQSKKANEEATLAVAEAERKKREQGGASNVVSGTKNRSSSSRKSVYSIKLHPGEWIFRIGTVRYKMDSSRRTLQRISDDESNYAALATEKDVKRSYVPRRLMIGKDEYVRIGNGNQLVRDPKKRTRILASEKVRWSLHTARSRLAKKRKYCQFFTRFGKCNKDDGKCPYIHDPSKIAVCTKFLNGLCFNSECKLTHKVIPERMPDCSYFLQGLCTNKNCPYRHVHVNPSASMCEGFLRGYCADGNECRKKHSYVCPTYGATGSCPQGSKCKLHHPKRKSKGKKSKQSREKKNALGRYFGSIGINISEPGTAASGKHSVQDDDSTFSEGSITDYISLDQSGENSNGAHEQTSLNESDPMDLELVDFDELIQPIRIMNT